MVTYLAVPPGQRNIAVMVQTTTPTTPRQLTRPTGQAEDFSPAWSPDGREIAFLRRVPDQSCEIRIVSASGGAESVVGQCEHHHLPSFDWTPDGSGLIDRTRVVEGNGWSVSVKFGCSRINKK